MLNVLIAGIGGQGSVLAAKILAAAAQARGWKVRTAETIGMAQRGGNVTSHVRMGDAGEEVHAPLIARGTADCIVALEPGEAVRALPYLAPDGLLVCARTAIPSVETTLSGEPYEAEPLLAYLEGAAPHFLAVDEAAICEEVGSRKVANLVMLASAVAASNGTSFGLRGAIGTDELVRAMEACVKPAFVALNRAAIDAVIAHVGAPSVN